MYNLINKVFEYRGLEIRKFPGCLPISLARNMLPRLPYGFVWSPKADGTRYFLWIMDDGGSWLVGRDNKVKILSSSHGMSQETSEDNTSFANRMLSNIGEEMTGTFSILDVEMMPSKTRRGAYHLVVFDTLVYHNINLVGFPYNMRHSMSYEFVMSATIMKTERQAYRRQTH